MKKQLFKQLEHDNSERRKSKYKDQEAESMSGVTNKYENLKYGPCDGKLNSKGKCGMIEG